MANASPTSSQTKRKKLDKPNDKTPERPISYGVKSFCCTCGLEYSRQKGFFPVSHSPVYRGTGYLPICNDCIDKSFNDYIKQYGSPKAAMRRMCIKMDMYWSNTLWESVEKTAGVNSKVRAYIQKTNIVRYIDKTFDDTIREEECNPFSVDVGDRITIDDDQKNKEPVDKEIVEFWGSGYTADFYRDLQRRYNEWTADKETITPQERALYKQICLLESIINKDAAAGKSIVNSVSSLNALLGSMNLKPVQQNATGETGSNPNTPFGVWIRKWENEEPIPEPDPEFEDVDGIRKYITVWLFGHLCHMLHIKNSYCRLYEEEIEKLRVARPEFDSEDDDTLLYDVLSSHGDSDDD